MTRMAETARAENARARAAWGEGDERETRQIDWLAHDPDFPTRLVPRVMSCLRAGLGADDMQANGTCTAPEARQVIAWLRRIDALAGLYGRAK